MGMKRSSYHLCILYPAIAVGAILVTLGLVRPWLDAAHDFLPVVCDPSEPCNRLDRLKPTHENSTKITEKSFGDVDLSGTAASGNENSADVTVADPCDGRRIYLYSLPSGMNDDIIAHCDETKIEQFCHYVKNAGLGRRLTGWESDMPVVRSKKAGANLSVAHDAWRSRWYFTHMKMLDELMLRGLRHYPCLEPNASRSDVLFIPSFVGWQWWSIVMHGEHDARGDEPGKALAGYLSQQQPFVERGGRNHVLAVGRPIWDLIRRTEHGWGTNLLYLPQMANVTVLVTETTPYHDRPNRIVSVPNPTSFHPASQAELEGWLAHVRIQRRPYLYSFVGGRRSKDTTEGRLRQVLFDQCSADPRCLLLDCASETVLEMEGGVEVDDESEFPAAISAQAGSTKIVGERLSVCMDPRKVTAVMLQSRFCLQPVGDSATRRSTFDSLTAGCIPVYFSEASFEQQYEWFFPQDRTNLSVRLLLEEVMGGSIRVGDVLKKIRPRRVRVMREAGLSSVPGILWWDHTAGVRKDFKDQFDVIVENMLKLAGSEAGSRANQKVK